MQYAVGKISIHVPRAGCDSPRTCTGRVPLNFNPRTPCGVRRDLCGAGGGVMTISIHVPRAGCDEEVDSYYKDKWDFNPRTPCGVRPTKAETSRPCSRFQSTYPVRGATICKFGITYILPFQSTYPVRGATGRPSNTARISRFQSTYPVRGATANLTILTR